MVLSKKYIEEHEGTERLRKLVPKSAEHFEHALQHIPGGSGRWRLLWPMPVYVNRAEGAYLYDLDGREYVDTLMGFGPLILGHRPPAVIAALREQLDYGVLFGAPNSREVGLAELITDAVPGAERVVFHSTGTEATMAAVRMARAVTGRPLLAKFEGGYHGWSDGLLFNGKEPHGPVEHPTIYAESAGIVPRAEESVVVLPFNHAAALDLIREKSSDLACVIVEGVQGSAGVIPARPGFLNEVQALCRASGILFILDETITGFRLAPGGAAEVYGLTPDLLTFGKGIGGGLPIGAVAGRAEIIESTIRGDGASAIRASGTHSGNPMSMVAGYAQVSTLLAGGAAIYRRLAVLGDRLRSGVQALLDKNGIEGEVTGSGSIFGFHLQPKSRPIESIRDLSFIDPDPRKLLGILLLGEGVFTSTPIHLNFLSTQHTEADVDRVVEGFEGALMTLREAEVI